jgi:hypothetical protein
VNVIKRVSGVSSTSAELVVGLARRGKWWLIPLVGMMGVCALLLGVVTVIEYAAPFVYSIF